MEDEETPKILRRPMFAHELILRILFVLASLWLLSPTAPSIVVGIWLANWSQTIVRDLIFGWGPTQGVIGGISDLVGWSCWLLMCWYLAYSTLVQLIS